jgi:hypothetical protein
MDKCEARSPPVYGKTDVDSDEKSVLILSPKFAVYTKIDNIDMDVQMETGKAKIRWDRLSNGYKEEEDLEEKLTSEEVIKSREMEYKSRSVFDSEGRGKITLGNQRPTDCKNNRRTILPEARPIMEEAELELRTHVWKGEVTKYKKKYCNEEGKQNYTNLTPEQARGLKKLIKRRDAGEIVITVGDKDKKLSVSTVESYRQQGEVHIKGAKAKEVWWPEIREAQKLTDSVSRMFSNVVFVGGNLSENSAEVF